MRRLSLMLAAAALSTGTAHAAPACDLALGQAVFTAKCATCHALDAHQVGPRLGGLLGRPAGKAKGFAFTDAMASAGFRWDVERLSAFLGDPQAYVPGTSMAFRGVSAPQEREALVCFFKHH